MILICVGIPSCIHIMWAGAYCSCAQLTLVREGQGHSLRSSHYFKAQKKIRTHPWYNLAPAHTVHLLINAEHSWKTSLEVLKLISFLSFSMPIPSEGAVPVQIHILFFLPMRQVFYWCPAPYGFLGMLNLYLVLPYFQIN